MNKIKIVREALCYFQGDFAQYFSLAKLQLDGLRNRLRTNADIRETRKDFHFLTDQFLNDSQLAASKELISMLLKLYSGRGTGPRICTKALVEDEKKDGQKLITKIYRSPEVNYDKDHPPEENTAFNKIMAKDTEYLENNIPKAVINGQYENIWLDKKSIEIFKNSQHRNRQTKKEIIQLFNDEWESYWLPDHKGDVYRSTLVVPMTFINNKTNDIFKQKILGVEKDRLGDDTETYRMILGFLCLDHQDTKYFVKEDISTGFMFADMLSMYLVVQKMVSVDDAYIAAKKKFANLKN